ncbi:MAG: Re/Si-specific NAD(P)(+) transhydrogenase subunit alpha [Candidatus Eisenbacteria bacterium]
MITVAVPRETTPGETRVALIPASIAPLLKAGVGVRIQAGAGDAAGFSDAEYREAGASIAATVAETFAGAEVVLKVREPRALEGVPGGAGSGHEADLLAEGAVLIGLLNPSANAALFERLTARGVIAYAMEKLPRISRAQKMDVLSSMSTVAGYKAALLAADSLPRFFPLLMTAAGTIAPARVFVLGAGVAGLQTIATARRLGAVVSAFDIRPAVREEVQSLGATFVATEQLDASAVAAGGYAKEQTEDQQQRTRELLAKHIAQSDAVITTAVVPGRRAPVLVTEAMVKGMRRGSVIVDLAAEQGGNCELTEPGRDVVKHGVQILGPLQLVAQMGTHASQMYARNISALLLHLIKDGKLHFDWKDEITRETCVTRAADAAIAGAAPAATGAPVAAGAASNTGGASA